MTLITPAMLAYCGAANPTVNAPILAAAAAAHGIDTAARVLCWLPNPLNESGLLTLVREDLNYSTAARLCAVYPSHFHSLSAAKPYVNNPKALANYVYAALGGWDFIGRGWGQVTGHANYQAYAGACGKPLSAIGAWMETPAGAADSAAWYFQHANCGPAADHGDLLSVRRAWAGGGAGIPIGWANVQRLHGLLMTAMGGGADVAARVAGFAPATVLHAGVGAAQSTADLNAASLAGTLTEPEGA